jgi:thiol:disulfide interchange protein DsbC
MNFKMSGLWLLSLLFIMTACSSQTEVHGVRLMEKIYTERLAMVAKRVQQAGGELSPVDSATSVSANLLTKAQQVKISAAPIAGLFPVHAPNRVLGYVDPAVNFMIVCDGECVSNKGAGGVSVVSPDAARHKEPSATEVLGSQATWTLRAANVSASPVNGLREVLLEGPQIVYADAKLEHVFWGHLVDLRSGVDLTEQRYHQLERIDWSQLPLADASEQVRGNGRRRLAVFLDPESANSQAFIAKTLKTLTDVTIYTFLIPAPSSASAARTSGTGRTGEKSVASDEASLERNRQLGRRLQIGATPAMVFPNGRMISLSGFTRDLQEFMPSLLEFWLDDV